MTDRYLGDYGFWRDTPTIKDFDKHDVLPDRSLYVNGEAMSNVIFGANGEYEGDVVPIGEYAGQQFAFAWWREGKDSDARATFGRLRGKGYDFATTDKFKVNREHFYVDGDKIYHADTVLMACPAERYDKEQKKEEIAMARRMGALKESVDDEFNEVVSSTTHDTGVKLEPIRKRRK